MYLRAMTERVQQEQRESLRSRVYSGCRAVSKGDSPEAVAGLIWNEAQARIASLEAELEKWKERARGVSDALEVEQNAYDECDTEREGLRAELERVRGALQRIADHDWTEPPSEMPDEMARAALSPQPQQENRE